MLTQEELKRLLSYDPETGVFTWLVPLKGRKANKVGSIRPDGYTSIMIKGIKYLAHRLAWYYVTGEWPKNYIDHVNLDKSDTRFKNLREATATENKQNTLKNAGNSTGYKGVTKHKDREKFQAQATFKGKQVYLGVFNSVTKASEAYQNFAKQNHGEFYNATV